jgi:hypothetical protein
MLRPEDWTSAVLGAGNRYFNPFGWPGRLLRKTISQIRCRIVGLRGFRQLHQSRRNIFSSQKTRGCKLNLKINRSQYSLCFVIHLDVKGTFTWKWILLKRFRLSFWNFHSLKSKWLAFTWHQARFVTDFVNVSNSFLLMAERLGIVSKQRVHSSTCNFYSQVNEHSRPSSRRLYQANRK